MTEYEEKMMFLNYEVRSCWWAGLVWWDYGQELVAKYFAWKVKRKYEQYRKNHIMLYWVEKTTGKTLAELSTTLHKEKQ